MPLVIEDGTIVAGATSYATVNEADTLLSLMGEADTWLALSLADREAKMAQGADLIDDASVYVYDGHRVSAVQERAWPRSGATYGEGGPLIGETQIPGEVRRANIMAAAGLADGSITRRAFGRDGQVKSESPGDGVSVSYFSAKEAGDPSAPGSIGRFAGVGWPEVTGLLAPLLDTAYYDSIAKRGVSAAEAARRGPAWTAPGYGRLFSVGAHDNPDAGDDLTD